MRKFTLLISLLVLAGMSFGQDNCEGFSKNTSDPVAANKITAPLTKASYIWYEDFNKEKWSATVTADEFNGYQYVESTPLPAGWAVYDGNDLGYLWHWTDVAPRGAYTGSPSAFDPHASLAEAMGGSYENGYFVLESDFYNTTENGTMVTTPVAMDSYVEFGPIDLTGHSNIQLTFNQMFRYCCYSTNKLSLYVSTDYNPSNPTAATWLEFDTKGGTLSNDYTLTDARTAVVNISKVAGNKAGVYIRFRQSGNKASHYFWIIDDIAISDLPANDLIVKDSWYDYLYTYSTLDEDASVEFVGGYTNIPAQVSGKFVSFRTAIQNFGFADQTFQAQVKINKDGAEVYNQLSQSLTLSCGDTDTARIETKFTPSGKGVYQVSGSIVMENSDNDPSNNNFGYDFKVTDNFYSRVYADKSANFGTGGPSDWADGGSDGEAIAQRFDLPDGSGSVKLAGLRFFFPDYAGREAELAAIKAGNYSCIAKVWPKGAVADNVDVTPDDDAKAFILSDQYTITEKDLNTWIYIPFSDEGNLIISEAEENFVWAGIEVYSGSTMENRVRFEVGADASIKEPYWGGACYVLGGDAPNWIIGFANYAIDLYLNEMPTMVTFNVDMTDATFTEGTDVLYVTGSFAGWAEPGKTGSVAMSDADGDKIYSATVEVAANTTYAYKYFKNAGWDGGEWTGDPNRSVVVAESNVVTDDIFGVRPPDGVKENQLNAISVYPNPFNNEMLIKNAKDIKSITVSNVVGQTVMVKTGITEKYSLNTSELKSGIYFITFTDNNNNKLTVRRIKQ